MAATCSSFPALFGGVSGAAAAPSPPHRTGTGSAAAAAAAAAFLAAALPRHHPWPLLQSRRWSSHGSCCAGRGETTATAAGLEEDEDGEEEYYYYSDDEEPQPPQQQRKKRSRKTRKRKKSAAAVAAADAEGDPKETTEAASASASPLLLPQLDDVNPVGLGRRYRQAFDDVWRKFSSLASISSPASASLSTISSPLETEVEVEEETVGSMNKARKKKSILLRDLDFGWPVSEFTIPGAEDTTVLVVGATSRVGRILVRKLMLRGYKVKALVRRTDEQVEQMLPRSVSIVVGDVGELSTLQEAVKGCDKIVYCATARSTITADLFRVDYKGVCNVIKAYQDYNNKLAQLRAGKSSKSKLLLAKFKSAESLERWQIGQGNYFPDRVSRLSTKDEKEMDAKFEFTESGEAVFSGYVFTKGGYIDLSTRLSLPLGSTLDRYDGLLLSVGGDGRGYVLILEVGPLSDLSQSRLYFARVNTKMGFCRVRVPFSFFRPVKPDHPPLDPFLIHTLTIRFEPKRQRSMEGQEGAKQDLRSFKLILEYIKALPTGQETNFILVSCTGLGVEPNRREQVLKAKKSGEDSLRRSGLGYTIVRPGPLQEEPGGQRALVFDQGNRISQGISCADVADICVKALHDPTARNKSFDVCYEYVSEEGNELYQLIAHLPNKANNYLTPALSLLETNT